jgi:hypothetical protein
MWYFISITGFAKSLKLHTHSGRVTRECEKVHCTLVFSKIKYEQTEEGCLPFWFFSLQSLSLSFLSRFIWKRAERKNFWKEERQKFIREFHNRLPPLPVHLLAIYTCRWINFEFSFSSTFQNKRIHAPKWVEKINTLRDGEWGEKKKHRSNLEITEQNNFIASAQLVCMLAPIYLCKRVCARKKVMSIFLHNKAHSCKLRCACVGEGKKRAITHNVNTSV